MLSLCRPQRAIDNKNAQNDVLSGSKMRIGRNTRQSLGTHRASTPLSAVVGVKTALFQVELSYPAEAIVFSCKTNRGQNA